MKRYSLIGLLTVLVAVTVWAAIIEVPEAPARMTAVVVGGGGGGVPPAGTYSLVQQASDNGIDHVALTGVTAGNLIVVVFGEFSTGQSLTCSDGTSSLTAATQAAGTYASAQLFYLLSANSGDRTYTVSGEASSAMFIWVGEFTKTSGTIALDAQNHDLGDGDSTVTTGSITTASGSVLSVAYWYGYGSGNGSSHQINGVAADNVYEGASGSTAVWYRITSASFTGQGTCTDPDSGYWGAGIASFKLE